MPAKVISFINLKGGVAKTTTTVGTAIALSEHFHKKVLVIDLDPQTNATTFLIGEKRWQELAKRNHTLYPLFKDAVDNEQDFSLEDTIQHQVGNITDAPTIDLLPSSIELVYIQDELFKMQYHVGDPFSIMEWKLSKLKSRYDYILIDCPPNLGLLSLNGLTLSNAYVIPAIPDILSTYGITQITNRIDKYTHNKHLKIKLLGVVFTKVKVTASLHTMRQEEFREAHPSLYVFNSTFPESVKYASAALYDQPATFRQKWGGTKNVEPFYNFWQELELRLNQGGTT